MDFWSSGNLLQRHPAHGALGSHVLDPDDAAGSRFIGDRMQIVVGMLPWPTRNRDQMPWIRPWVIFRSNAKII